MDALSDVLQTVRLTGGVFVEARFTAPWCVASRFTSEDCRPFIDNPVQLVAYHYVTRGRWWLQVAGEAPVEVRAGEAVLLPRNDPHVLGSATGLRPVCARSWSNRRRAAVSPGSSMAAAARPRIWSAASSPATSTATR